LTLNLTLAAPGTLPRRVCRVVAIKGPKQLYLGQDLLAFDTKKNRVDIGLR